MQWNEKWRREEGEGRKEKETELGGYLRQPLGKAGTFCRATGDRTRGQTMGVNYMRAGLPKHQNCSKIELCRNKCLPGPWTHIKRVQSLPAAGVRTECLLGSL